MWPRRQAQPGCCGRYYWGNSPPIGDASPCGSSGINSAQITHPLKAKFQNGLVCYNDDPMAMADADNKSAPQLTQRVECAPLAPSTHALLTPDCSVHCTVFTSPHYVCIHHPTTEPLDIGLGSEPGGLLLRGRSAGTPTGWRRERSST